MLQLKDATAVGSAMDYPIFVGLEVRVEIEIIGACAMIIV